MPSAQSCCLRPFGRLVPPVAARLCALSAIVALASAVSADPSTADDAPRLPAAASQSGAPTTPTEQFENIAKSYDEFRLTVYPEYALGRGIKDRAGELTDTSLAGVNKRAAVVRSLLAMLREIDASKLSPLDATDHALLTRELALSDEGFRFNAWMMPVGGRNGPHQDIAQMVICRPSQRSTTTSRTSSGLQACRAC
jgi:uncharacterized protein (DUF885 family)